MYMYNRSSHAVDFIISNPDYTDMSGDPRDNQWPVDYSKDGTEDLYIEMNADEYIHS